MNNIVPYNKPIEGDYIKSDDRLIESGFIESGVKYTRYLIFTNDGHRIDLKQKKYQYD